MNVVALFFPMIEPEADFAKWSAEHEVGCLDFDHPRQTIIVWMDLDNSF